MRGWCTKRSLSMLSSLFIHPEERRKKETKCIQNLLNAKNLTVYDLNKGYGHECWSALDPCYSLNENDFHAFGLIPTYLLTGISYIYLCNDSVLHVCNTQRCQLWQDTGTCPLSNIIHGTTYQNDEGRTGHTMRNTMHRDVNLKTQAVSTGYIPDITEEGFKRKKPSLEKIVVKKCKSSPGLNNSFRRKNLMSSGNVFFGRTSPSIVHVDFQQKTKVTPVEQPTDFSDFSAPVDKDRKAVVITAAMRARFHKSVKTLVTNLFYSNQRSKINSEAKQVAERLCEVKFKKYLKRIAEEDRPPTYIEKLEIAINTPVNVPLKILSDDGKLVEKYTRIIEHVWKIVAAHGPRSFSQAGHRSCVCLTLGVLYGMQNSGIVVNDTNFLPQNPELIHLPSLQMIQRFQTVELQKKSYSSAFTRGNTVIRNAYATALQKGVPIAELMLNVAVETHTQFVDGEIEKRYFMMPVSKKGKKLAKLWSLKLSYLEEDYIYTTCVSMGAMSITVGKKQQCFDHLKQENEKISNRIRVLIERIVQKIPTIPTTQIKQCIVFRQAWMNAENFEMCMVDLRTFVSKSKTEKKKK